MFPWFMRRQSNDNFRSRNTILSNWKEDISIILCYSLLQYSDGFTCAFLIETLWIVDPRLSGIKPENILQSFPDYRMLPVNFWAQIMFIMFQYVPIHIMQYILGQIIIFLHDVMDFDNLNVYIRRKPLTIIIFSLLKSHLQRMHYAFLYTLVNRASISERVLF